METFCARVADGRWNRSKNEDSKTDDDSRFNFTNMVLLLDPLDAFEVGQEASFLLFFYSFQVQSVPL